MIILAVENEKTSNRVYVYNETGKAFDVAGQLHNYTAQTVAVRNGNQIVIYDERGRKIKTYPYDFISVDPTVL